MEEHFKTTEDYFRWCRHLPKEDILFLANLNWALFHQDLGDEDSKTKVVKKNLELKMTEMLAEKTREIGEKTTELTTLKRLLDEKDNTLKDGVNDNSEKLDSIASILEKQFGNSRSSCTKGKDGEGWVLSLFAGDPTLSATPVSTTGHQGDLVVSFKESGIKSMLEIKNLKATVTASDLKKFYHDLETNNHYKCGVLLTVKGSFPMSCEEYKVYLTAIEKKPYCFVANLWLQPNPDKLLKSVMFMLQAYAGDRNRHRLAKGLRPDSG